MPKIQPTENDPTFFTLFCPGCKSAHSITTKIWTFNGDLEKPTIRNSILVHQVKNEETGQIYIPRCHSFVTDGQIRFLDDCDHDLKGTTVDLPDCPY